MSIVCKQLILDQLMPRLLDSRPEEVARRIRHVAEGLTDPADIEATEAYAKELERAAENPERMKVIGAPN